MIVLRSAPIQIAPPTIRKLIGTLLLMPLLGRMLAGAELTLSSPVGGYCRIGRFTPVEIAGNVASDVLLEGDGFFPVQIPAGPSERITVPVLMIAPPNGVISLRQSGDKRAVRLPFRVLSEEERLVGLIGSAKANDARFLFPGKQTVGVTLEPSQLLTGPLAAWEALDAIICHSAPMPVTNRASIGVLLGSGIALVVRSPQPPDDRWPWLRHGGWWVLQHDPVGPRTVISKPAYLPVQGWPSGASNSGTIWVISFGLLSLIAVLTFFVRNRSFRLAGASVCALSMVGLIYGWSRRSLSQHEAAGTIAYLDAGLLQHDFWEYRSPGTDAMISCVCFRKGHRASSPTRPVLMFAAQATRQMITLNVDASGEPQVWTGRLEAREKVAFLTRLIEPYPSKLRPHSAAINSPLQSVVRAVYTPPGVRIIGQGHPRTDRQDGFVEVFLERDRAGIPNETGN